MSVALNSLTLLAPGFPSAQTVLAQPAVVNVAQWQKVATATRDPEVAWALGNFPNLVTRNQIIGLAHPNATIRRRRVAIAGLMWGYGVSGARWGQPWVTNVSAFLGPALDPLLGACEALLAAGSIATAYQLFTVPGRSGIQQGAYQGIGPAYFTKILYFLGRNSSAGVARYPLILDTKVSMALSQLTGNRLLVRPESYRPFPDSGAYQKFVETMHAWAAAIGVLPDQIEHFLWTEAAKPGSPLWTTCQAQHALSYP